MIQVVECEGAPRDLGRDQGGRCRGSLRADYVARSRWQRFALRLRAGSTHVRQVERDLWRFFPGQAEALEAMARAARVPSAWLVERIADEVASGAPANCVALAAGTAVTRGGSLLARSLPQAGVVRRSRPDAGFRSVEWTQPWRTGPLAGVNESGLAVVAVAETAGSGRSDCAAPALLLAGDCLARFDQIDGAVDWLLARPGGGNSVILLAHADGAAAGVRMRGTDREVFRPAGGLFVQTRGDERRREIEKTLRLNSGLVAADLGRALEMPIAVVDPERRRIGLLHPLTSADEDRWFEA